MTHTRHIQLQGAFNVRDLGGYPTTTGGMTRWRSFLRADALHQLSESDIESLLALGLRTVVDLRSANEIASQPSTFSSHRAVRYHHVPLFEGLSPVDVVIADKGKIDLYSRYIDAAQSCRTAIAQVVATIADAEEGIVLFNCTAGKDRTGIVAAMLLSLAGVADDEIAQDYALTATVARSLMVRLKTTAMARGLDEITTTGLLSSEPPVMLAFLRHMEERYGGFATYLADHPDCADGIRTIRERLAT